MGTKISALKQQRGLRMLSHLVSAYDWLVVVSRKTEKLYRKQEPHSPTYSTSAHLSPPPILSNAVPHIEYKNPIRNRVGPYYIYRCGLWEDERIYLS